MNDTALARLARAYGIEPGFTDAWGAAHRTPAACQRALLGAMGVACANHGEARASLEDLVGSRRARLLPAVIVVAEDRDIVVRVNVATNERASLDWKLGLETGEECSGSSEIPAAEPPCRRHRRRTVRVVVPGRLPSGYHRLHAALGTEADTTSLIVTPGHCYVPRALAGYARWWGLAAQLYALDSRRNWGMGDLADLSALVDVAADAGAEALGVSPLHALFPNDPAQASPYAPSSRLYLNVLYLDVAGCDAVLASEAACKRLRSDAFRTRIDALRQATLVDYRGVAAAKLEILELAFRDFVARDEQENDFTAYCREQGEDLYRHALYEALAAHFHILDDAARGWPQWPAAYRDPESPAVAEFAATHGVEIDFHRWLQWLAERQLRAADRRAGERGMGIGLYFDLAVGVAAGGAETWANQALYALDASIGAPPDRFNAKGQRWGLPPMIPERLQRSGYALFATTLRRNMRYGGALRIDHVMGLMRLFWLPGDADASGGAYVRYPLDHLLGILALESQRNRCLVVGEDLGTVPEEVRRRLRRANVLSYRLLFFEQSEPGRFLPPDRYPRQALVAVSTHDLATWAGWWTGRDLEWRQRLDLYPSAAYRAAQVEQRRLEREGLVEALTECHLLPGDATPPAASVAAAKALAAPTHRYLARSPAMLQMVQMDDLSGELEQMNLPATVDEHPNWRRRYRVPLETLACEPLARELLAAVREERSKAPVVPRATYRLQLHRGFTFRDARALVGYLDALGISHCYTSPYLRSRPGSTHGYDVTDHTRIDSELGRLDDYRDLVLTLAAHGMSHVADLVPNHMGVMGDDNRWWLDVLEHGPAARHARFFDIDWNPAERALTGKVLVPVLGAPYGDVLERGELTLELDDSDGRIVLRYHEHLFRLDPRSYAVLLEDSARRAGASAAAALAELGRDFARLPARSRNNATSVKLRYDSSERLRARLRALVRDEPAIEHAIGETLVRTNEDAKALHRLLERQAWRLAFWRTAADEINYRRFFDINDLAGLRVEDPEVFEACHGRILELVRSGAVGGLRLDHPDGLYDPARYYHTLAARLAEVTGDGGEPFYVVVEKILAPHEHLPSDWPIAGSTGYDFSAQVNGLFVDPAAEPLLTRTYTRFAGSTGDFSEHVYRAKLRIIEMSLGSELRVLVNALHRLAQADPKTRDFTRGILDDALRKVSAAFPVYRTYISERGVSEADRQHVEWAIAQARHRSIAGEQSVFDFIAAVLLNERPGPRAYRRAMLAFTMKFQQFTAPVAAKGVEDTALYNYHRLLSLNEVGSDPRRFGTSVAAFHHHNTERARSWPHGMLGTTTHDSKRSEDVRARLDVLTELAKQWRERLGHWRRHNRRFHTELDTGIAPSPNDEYLIYQTLLGSWPLEPFTNAGLATYTERIETYLIKAAREAKARTSWLAPDEEYEAALGSFARGVLDPERNALFFESFLPFAGEVTRLGLLNSLSQTLLKLTAPGVPDVYQGNELWDFSLVDPDNRRPVDYARRAELLDELAGFHADARRFDPATLLTRMNEGLPKLHVTWRALNFRRSAPGLFESGEYLPLTASGARAEHVCAFARRDGSRIVVVIAPRLFATLARDGSWPTGAVWGDTSVTLPIEVHTGLGNLLGGPAVSCRDATLSLADACARFPVALLTNEPEDSEETGT